MTGFETSIVRKISIEVQIPMLRSSIYACQFRTFAINQHVYEVFASNEHAYSRISIILSMLYRELQPANTSLHLILILKNYMQPKSVHRCIIYTFLKMRYDTQSSDLVIQFLPYPTRNNQHTGSRGFCGIHLNPKLSGLKSFGVIKSPMNFSQQLLHQ